jgi:hypothetical protein
MLSEPQVTADHCREKLAMWRELLLASTARSPLDKEMRAKVVRYCEDNIRLWERRLALAERREDA